jgi:hypothetical protein
MRKTYAAIDIFEGLDDRLQVLRVAFQAGNNIAATTLLLLLCTLYRRRGLADEYYSSRYYVEAQVFPTY